MDSTLLARGEQLRADIKAKRAALTDLVIEAGNAPPSRTAEYAVRLKSADLELRGLLDAADHLRDAGEQRQVLPEPTGPAARAAERGRIKALKSTDRIADHMPRDPEYGSTDVGLGQWLKALVTGEWGDLPPAVKAMSIGTPSAGGYLVPSPTAGRIIDLARNASRVVQAGAVTIPMASSTLRVPRLITDPTADWKAENADATSSDLAFDAVDFEAHTLVALASLSVELAEDGTDVNNVVESALAAALAVELDRAALYGSGNSDEPTGVAATGGIETINVSAGLPGDYSDFSLAVQRIRQNNIEPTGLIYSPIVAGELDRLTDTTGQPLRPPQSYADLAKFTTNQVQPTEAFVADWSRLMIGLRTNVTIEASRAASDASGSAFRSLRVLIRAYLRADVQLAHPDAFCYLTSFAEAS